MINNELNFGIRGISTSTISIEDKNKLEEYLSNLHEYSDYIENAIVMCNSDYKENCMIKINGENINLADIDFFEGLELFEGVVEELCAWIDNDNFDANKEPIFCIDTVDYTQFLMSE